MIISNKQCCKGFKSEIICWWKIFKSFSYCNKNWRNRCRTI